MKSKIAVLVATYNGEKYILEQLLSIEKSMAKTEKVREYEILVRDDGSTDNTVQVVKDYGESNSSVTLVEDMYKRGFKNSFKYLMSLVPEDVDYIFFSDQDDIWEEEKVNRFLDVAGEVTDVPLLVYSDLLMFGEVLELPIKLSNFYKWEHDNDGIPAWLLANTVTGAAMMINYQLLARVLTLTDEVWEKERYHDWLIAKVAGLTGEYRYIDMPLTKYRQHANNASHDWNRTSGLKMNQLKMYIEDWTRMYYEIFSRNHALQKSLNANSMPDKSRTLLAKFSKFAVGGRLYRVFHFVPFLIVLQPNEKSVMRQYAKFITFVLFGKRVK